MRVANVFECTFSHGFLTSFESFTTFESLSFTKLLVQKPLYQDLRTKNLEQFLVPRLRHQGLQPISWYQDLYTKNIVSRAWYQEHGTKNSVPKSWYQELDTEFCGSHFLEVLFFLDFYLIGTRNPMSSPCCYPLLVGMYVPVVPIPMAERAPCGIVDPWVRCRGVGRKAL